MPVSEARRHRGLEGPEAPGLGEAEGRREEGMRAGCRKPGCLTHPVLCEGMKCADYERKIYKVVTHTLPHGKERRNGERPADVLNRRAPETEEEKGRKRSKVLGGLDSQDCGDRRRIKNSCLQKVRSSPKAGLVQ